MTLAHAYAQAIHDVAKSGSIEMSELAQRCKTLLVRRGHQKLTPQIIRALNELEASDHDRAPAIKIASQADLEILRDDITAALKSLNAEHGETYIDQTLIGGYTVETNDRRHDASYKRKLISLYQQLTRK